MSLPPESNGSPWAPPSVTPAAVPPPPLTTASVGPPVSVPLVDAPPSGGPKRSRGKLVGGLVGVGALVAAGTFAVVTITGNDDRGGAASPEEVGTSLTQALDGEDVLGVVDLLLPGERDTFRQPLVDLFDHLRRLDVVSGDASLDQVGGIDISFTDVTVRTEPTNVDDVSNIFLSGSSTVSVDGARVPLGSLLVDEVFGGDRPDMDTAPETDEFTDTQLTVVEQDGRWYLSALYSIAEQARGDRDIPEQGVAPVGADSPEGAVEALLDAVAGLDLERVIAALDPTEMAALQRYAPLFLDDGQQALDDSGLQWSISDTAFDVTGSGDRRSVGISSLRLDLSQGDTEARLTVGDGCAELTVDGDTQRACPGDTSGLDDALAELPDDEFGQAVRTLVSTVQDAFDDYRAPGIAVHEVDGSWFVSPIRTGSDQVDAVLTALDRGEITDIVDAARDAVDAFSSAFDDLFGISVDDPFATIDPLDTGDSSGDTGDTGDSATPDTVDPDDPFAAVTACYQAADAATGVQCMQDGIADGSIDPTFVAVPIRMVQCGVAEQYWGSLSQLSDDEFVAMITQASPCFLDLVARGELSAYEVPDELVAPQCVEGRNWYAVFDDEAYNTRVFDCAAAVRDAL